MFHQLFIKGVIDLQSGDEGSCSDIIIFIINQNRLALKMIDVALESFSLLPLDRKEMVVILLELLPRGVLVTEGITDLLGALERSWKKRVEPVSYTHLTLPTIYSV